MKTKILAIGDGYNDSQMLLAADCGVKLVHDVSSARKSMAATGNGDFIITEFCQLQNLIFAHGYNCQRQISFIIFFYFYKNMILVVVEILF